MNQPVLSSAELAAHWAEAQPWDRYLEEEVQAHRELWEGVHRRASPPEWWAEEAGALPRLLRFLALSEDWCGDAANSLPVIARLVEALPGAELRVLKRDETLELMDRFLTGGSRSIPVVLVLAPDGALLGWWGPRPAPLQEFVLREKAAGNRPADEIYRDVRAWYARDRGETIARELLAAAAGDAKE